MLTRISHPRYVTKALASCSHGTEISLVSSEHWLTPRIVETCTLFVSLKCPLQFAGKADVWYYLALLATVMQTFIRHQSRYESGWFDETVLPVSR